MRTKVFAACFVSTLLLASMPAETGGASHRQVYELPAPTGPHPIGTLTFTLSDPSRSNGILAKTPGPRRINVQVWYPAEPGGGAGPAAYMDAPRAAYFLSDRKDPPYRFNRAMGADWARFIRGHASEMTPVYGKANRFPVLVYSPGLHSVAALGQIFHEELASQGYIVCGVDSPGVSGALSYADGAMAYAETATDLNLRFPQVVLDERFVLDQLQRTDGLAGSTLLHQRMDFQKVGAWGISFGGAAAIELAYVDPRIKGAANGDGSLWTDSSARPLDKPFMLLEHDGSGYRQPNLTRLWNNATGPAWDLIISDSQHENFGDTASIMKHFFPVAVSGYPNIGSIDQDRFVLIVRRALVAFFNAALGRGPASAIAGGLAGYPEAKLTHQATRNQP